MKRTVRFSPKALADLDRIWTYTDKEWGRRQAEEYVRSLHAVLELVAENPRISRDAGHIRPGLLKYPAGSHVIFFRLVKDHINVVRILHQRMDFARHL